MSSMFLTKAQRELVKFQQLYTLDLVKHKRRATHAQNTTQTEDDAIGYRFNPDEDDIDARLYDEIVDHEWLEEIKRQSDDVTRSESDSLSSDDSNRMTEMVDIDQNDDFIGFNTNVDDFLEQYKKQSVRAFSDYNMRSDIHEE